MMKQRRRVDYGYLCKIYNLFATDGIDRGGHLGDEGIEPRTSLAPQTGFTAICFISSCANYALSWVVNEEWFSF